MPARLYYMTSDPRLEPRRLTTTLGADQTSHPMRRGRLSTLLRGAVLIPLFLAAVLPDSVRTLVCRYTGVVMPEESCCPEVDARDLSSNAQLEDESCCVVKTVHLARLVSDRQSPVTSPTQHEISSCVAPGESFLLVARAPSVRRSTILPVGPPIVLLKHAFLI